MENIWEYKKLRRILKLYELDYIKKRKDEPTR